MNTISNERLESLQRQFMEEGFNDIRDSEVMQLVEENLALRKERERAEPVAAESYIDDSDLLFAIDLNDDSEDFQTAQWLKELRRRRAAPPAPVVPVGLRIALSNAGIAAPESDEVLWASQQDYIQMLVTWVKERKPFKPAPVADDSLPYDPQIAEYEQMMEAEQAQADTTSQQFESLAGKVVVPAGWKLVPIEPTMQQEYAGYKTLNDTGKMSRLMKTRLGIIYRAMLSAAPEPCK